MAKKQHGVVSIRQLEGPLGFSQRSVARAVEAGRLHRVRRGVYAVGHTDLSRRGECLAAVLAVGPGALLSYYSAGWLWGLWSGPPAPFEVTAVARTLLDLAWKLRSDQLRRVLARAEDLGLFDLEAIHAVIERNRGHHGAKRLRFALAIYERPIWTRSEFERRFVERIIDSGLPRPATGWNELGHELDVYWPEYGFGVELDTWETHGTRDAFERDHDRDLNFALADVETIRVSERQFRREPDAIATKFGHLLDRRQARST